MLQVQNSVLFLVDQLAFLSVLLFQLFLSIHQLSEITFESLEIDFGQPVSRLLTPFGAQT